MGKGLIRRSLAAFSFAKNDRRGFFFLVDDVDGASSSSDSTTRDLEGLFSDMWRLLDLQDMVNPSDVGNRESGTNLGVSGSGGVSNGGGVRGRAGASFMRALT